MVNRKPKVRRPTAPARAVHPAVRKLFLAGLGAVSLAGKQGERVVNTLIEEGEDFRARTLKFTATLQRDARRAVGGAETRLQRAIAPVRARARRLLGDVEAGIGERVGGLLGRFGVPSKSEVEELVARVAELNREVRARTRRHSVI